MKIWIALSSLLVVSLAAAAEPTPPTEIKVSEDAKPLVDAIAQIGGIFSGLNLPKDAAEPAASDLVKKDAEATPASEPAAKAKRTAKNSVILITTGAATGAAVGGAVSKDKRGAIAGAAIGAVAGLIYDRMTHKNPGAI